MNKRYLTVAVIVLVVLVLGLSGWYLANQNTADNSASPTPTPTVSAQATATPTQAASDAATKSISYQGEEGKTALELLQSHYPDAEVSGEGVNAFVTAINGREADSAKHEFWKFLINGEDAQVGAGSYQTKASDTISWEIDTY